MSNYRFQIKSKSQTVYKIQNGDKRAQHFTRNKIEQKRSYVLWNVADRNILTRTILSTPQEANRVT